MDLIDMDGVLMYIYYVSTLHIMLWVDRLQMMMMTNL